MKTRDRILSTSRQLFNKEGERNITASDIALALDISPGNLYYHFKGKDQIIDNLWWDHQRSVAGVLSAPIQDPDLFDQVEQDVAGRIERCWLYLTVVLETMYSHRFIYHNLDDLRHRFDAIGKGIPRLLLMQRASCRALAAALLENSAKDSTPRRFDRIAESMTLTLMYWLDYDQLQRKRPDESATVHGGVLQILSVCAPYLGGNATRFYEECEAFHRRMLAAETQI